MLDTTKALLTSVFFATLFVPIAATAAEPVRWFDDRGRPVTEAVVSTETLGADSLLLGELHDNPNHHLVQARLLQNLVTSGRDVVVVWEMLRRDQQDIIDAYLAQPNADADGFAQRVGWAESGWPDWSFYRPIADVAIKAGLPMVAGGLEEGEVGRLIGQDLDAWGEARGWSVPALNDEERDRHLTAVFDGHCGLVPKERLAPMVTVQRARDLSLAYAMLQTDQLTAAVLISGNGHVRSDIGVPHILRRMAPGARMLVIGQNEGAPDTPAEPTDRYDWIGVSRVIERPDPCEALRRHFGGHKNDG